MLRRSTATCTRSNIARRAQPRPRARRCCSRRGSPRDGGVDALVPVPLHAQRLRERGYNQATEIARALGRLLGCRVCCAAFVRRALGHAADACQMAAARRATSRARSRSFATRGRRIAIVDDVITTGATVNALAAALLAAGAVEVHAWAVARTL